MTQSTPPAEELKPKLPPSLQELYQAEIDLIEGGRPEKLDCFKQRIDAESKFIKDWLALAPPPPLDSRFNRTQTDSAERWYNDLKARLESAIASAKSMKSEKENELKLRAAIPLLFKQKVEEQIARLKYLEKQHDNLTKLITK